MARMTVVIADETKEKLIELAGGERKIGARLDELVAEEYTRQTVTIERLAERVGLLEQFPAKLSELVGLILVLEERVSKLEKSKLF